MVMMRKCVKEKKVMGEKKEKRKRKERKEKSYKCGIQPRNIDDKFSKSVASLTNNCA